MTRDTEVLLSAAVGQSAELIFPPVLPFMQLL